MHDVLHEKCGGVHTFNSWWLLLSKEARILIGEMIDMKICETEHFTLDFILTMHLKRLHPVHRFDRKKLFIHTSIHLNCIIITHGCLPRKCAYNRACGSVA